MLIPDEKVREVAAVADEHERLELWFPLIRQYGSSVRELLVGVVQIFPFETDRHVASGLAMGVLRELENSHDPIERAALLNDFRGAFSKDQFLLARAEETELVLRAAVGEVIDPSLALTSGVQLRILKHPCTRVVLEYFSEAGRSKSVRHLAKQRLRKLPPESAEEKSAR
jgi:hypothetical protein